MVLALSLQVTAAFALDLGVPISQLHHTVWAPKDSAPADVWAIAQTRDGWLWFGAPSGLFRFDGVRFEHMDLGQGDGPQSEAVSTLFATESGDLLVGFARGGVSVLHNGAFRNYRDSAQLGNATVYSMAMDSSGAFWAATRDRLLRFDGTRWERIGHEWGFPDGFAGNAFLDPDGTLWVAGRDHVLSLAPGARRFETRLAVAPGTTEFIESADGRVWASSDSLLQLLPAQVVHPAKVGCSANSRASFVTLFDREGALWTLTDAGIGRIAHPEQLRNPSRIETPGTIASANESFPLAGTKSLMEDCEGNVWISNSSGIHRFRSVNISQLAVGDNGPRIAGFAASPTRLLMASRSSTYGPGVGDGLWAFDQRLIHLQPAKVPAAQAVCQARDGTVWVAGVDRLWHGRGDRFDADLPYPDNSPMHVVAALACNADSTPWVSILDHGLFQRTPTGWRRQGLRSDVSDVAPLSMTTSADGTLWMGYADGRLRAVGASGGISSNSAQELHVGPIAAILVGRRTLVGGERGVSLLRGKTFVELVPDIPDALKGVTGIVETDSGDVFLNTRAGAVRIGHEALEAVSANATSRVATEVFNTSDGYPGGGGAGPPQAVMPMVVAADGRIWLTGLEGIGWIDPNKIKRNVNEPHVVVRSLTTSAGTVKPTAVVELAANTRSVRIDYTALSFSQPERQRFRYRLTGVDDAWIEADQRREAFYTNLGPGKYRFDVLAANESGVWSSAPATFEIEIAPTFIQTRSFLALCVLAVAAAIAFGMRLRVRQITARARRQLDERLRERERIARELHDTLLQGTFGLVMKVQAAASRVPTDNPARQMLSDALVGADQLMSDSRDRIQDLRTQSDASDDLPHALARIGKELVAGASTKLQVNIEGRVRTLVPAVSEEAYRIGREAISNARQHAYAAAIEVDIIYGDREFRLRVRDDGHGMSIDGDHESKPGHWGLSGMRERAALIGATLTIWSRSGAGTEIELRIDSNLAYSAGPGRFRNSPGRP